MREYKKKVLSLQEQVNLLKSRGVNISDEDRVIRHLSNISYYRLSAYMLPFKIIQDNKTTNNFKKQTSWDDIYELYVFDRKLRLLIFNAIEKIEVAVRSRVVLSLSLKYGSHWHERADIFKNTKKTSCDMFKQIGKRISEERKNINKEVYVEHYWNTYNKPKTPPSWMIVELLYFNQLSKISKYLKYRSDRTLISDYFNLPPNIFSSWLHALNYVRNLCAHHARLWNRDLKITPDEFTLKKKYIKTDIKWLSSINGIRKNKIYYTLCIIKYLLQTINKNSSFGT